VSSTHADSDGKAVVSLPVTLRSAGTRMLRRRDAAYLGGAQWRRIWTAAAVELSRSRNRRD
jgi:hypothetical protein